MDKLRQQIKYFTNKRAGDGTLEELNVGKLHISNMVFKSEAESININFDNP